VFTERIPQGVRKLRTKWFHFLDGEQKQNKRKISVRIHLLLKVKKKCRDNNYQAKNYIVMCMSVTLDGFWIDGRIYCTL
jgi:hypothetical protein